VKPRNLCPYFQGLISSAPDNARRFEEEPGRLSAAKLLTKDEARRIAAEYLEAARVAMLLKPRHPRGRCAQ
jgi:hypothetical protein